MTQLEPKDIFLKDNTLIFKGRKSGKRHRKYLLAPFQENQNLFCSFVL